MEILIDVFGSDDDIDVPIYAACNMLDNVNAKFVLVGRKTDIRSCIIKRYGSNSNMYLRRISIIDCKDYITNNEEPAWAIKNKKESSIVKAYDYMKQKDNVVFISAGSTGALMAGALLKVKRIPGIHRPALTTILPTSNPDKKVVFLDSGANPQAKDISIVQYALLGEIYSKSILGVNSPKISLLNIGEEAEKGTPELKEVYKQLKAKFPNFIGNIEPRYILSGNTDVIVCDGLLGNIALKTAEGVVRTLKDVLKETFTSSVLNSFKGLMVKSTIKDVLKTYDYQANGGAVLLGVKKPVIKVHGSSKIETFEKAIIQAQYMLENKIVEKIEVELKKFDNADDIDEKNDDKIIEKTNIVDQAEQKNTAEVNEINNEYNNEDI